MKKLFFGTNYGHGSSAAIINEEGELVFAVEEGRLIGEKNTSKFPEKSLEIFQERYGEAAFWAEGWHIYRRLFHKGLFSTIKYGVREPFYVKSRSLKELRRLYEGLRFYKNSSVYSNQKICFVGHHLAHAFSLLPWGLPEKSLILVSDTTGEKESISSFYWSGKDMRPIASSAYPHSIGSIYHQLAYHLGFKGRTGPGKLMALSSLGEPIWLKQLHNICKVVNGKFYVDVRKYPAWKIRGAWLDFATRQSNKDFRKEILSSYHYYNNGINLAASIQKWFTEITFKCITQSLALARERHHLDVQHLGLVGGAALNCQANGEIVRRIKGISLDSVTVSPWSDDSGTAIGAAAWMLHKKQADIKFKPARVFVGPSASEVTDEISDNDINKAIHTLAMGHIVALVSGRLEFGPRALGGRCLLADPRKKEMVQVLNKMKNRPDFMPFAPVVLEKEFHRYFIGNGSSNMAWTVRATPDALKSIPAAIHVNKESRVQILRSEENSLLSRILKRFKRETGCGVLLLTSLNGNGEAIPAYLDTAEIVARRLGVAGLIWDGGWKQFNSC